MGLGLVEVVGEADVEDPRPRETRPPRVEGGGAEGPGGGALGVKPLGLGVGAGGPETGGRGGAPAGVRGTGGGAVEDRIPAIWMDDARPGAFAASLFHDGEAGAFGGYPEEDDEEEEEEEGGCLGGGFWARGAAGGAPPVM